MRSESRKQAVTASQPRAQQVINSMKLHLKYGPVARVKAIQSVRNHVESNWRAINQSIAPCDPFIVPDQFKTMDQEDF